MSDDTGKEKRIFGIVFLVIIIIGAYMAYDYYLSEPAVGQNDIVEINFIAWLTDEQVVFATSIVNEQSITADTLLDETHRYRPMAVTIGPSEPSKGTIAAIEGLEEGLMGMKEGEEKTIVIPAEKAYLPDESLLSTVSKTIATFNKTQTATLLEELERDITMTASEFSGYYGISPTVGDTISLTDWDGTITGVDEDGTVHVRGNPEIGDVMGALPWSYEVVEITDTSIVVQSLVEVGEEYQNAYGKITIDAIADDEITYTQTTLVETYPTAYGDAEIRENEDTFVLYVEPVVGTWIQTANGYARISEVGEDSFTLDSNPVYVGTDITYKVKVEMIIQAEDE